MKFRSLIALALALASAPAMAQVNPGTSPQSIAKGGTAANTASAAFANLVQPPSASTLGGIKSLTCSASNWFNTLSTAGALGCARPNFTDLAGSLALGQIPDSLITYAKIHNVTAAQLLGNPTGGAAPPSEISLGATFSFSGTALQSNALTGDVTAPVNSFATTIAANAVTNAKMATMAAWTFKANATSGAATPTDITINGLTAKASPAAADEVIIWDVAGVAVKKASVSSLSSAGSVASLNGQTGALVSYFPPQGRLTLSSGVAVLTGTVTGAASVFYTPSYGNLVPIYDGTNLIPTAFAEVSQATTDTTKSPAAVTTNSNYDVFCWVDAGTNRCTRGPLWTSNTARGTGAGTSELIRVNGIYLNANSITNGPNAQRGTYVGTVHSNGSSTIDYAVGGSSSGGTAASFGVWNMYNRTYSTARVIDNGVAYNYALSAERQARASAGNQAGFVVGMVEDAYTASYTTRMDAPAAANAYGYVRMDIDTVSSGNSVGVRVFAQNSAAVAVKIEVPYTAGTVLPSLGYHTIIPIEATSTATISIDGDSSATLNLSVWN